MFNLKNSNNYSINVQPTVQYLSNQSHPEKYHHVFAYTIAIMNSGNVAAKLLTRHWYITDANGHIEEVKGDGVVGEQPYLKPGEVYKYTSYAVIETPVGSMHGSYQMVADDGTHFDAPIAAFGLAMPAILH